MALRDELVRRIANLPEETLEDVARYLDHATDVSTAAYKMAQTKALTYLREGLPLHLESGRLTREQLHERR